MNRYHLGEVTKSSFSHMMIILLSYDGYHTKEGEENGKGEEFFSSNFNCQPETSKVVRLSSFSFIYAT